VICELLQDIRSTVLTMRRHIGFVAPVVMTFALGIGATTGVLSMAYGVLLRPLPYPAGDRLVRLWEEHPGGVSPGGNRWLSNHTYDAWVDRSRVLDGIGAVAASDYTVRFDDESVRMSGAAVSPSIFTMLDVTPALGRFFTPDEGEISNAASVVLSDRLWRERYGADRSVLGRQVIIDDQPHTIVGVGRPGLRFPDDPPQFWIPNTVLRAPSDGTRVFTALGRLRLEMTPAQAAAEGTSIARSVVRPSRTTEFFFGIGGPVVVHARAFAEDLSAPIRPALLVLTVAVMLLLITACASVANLLLSRGLARRREVAIRMAVGGSRGRIARQLLTESALLSAAGGFLGLFVAAALIRVVPLLAPSRFPRLDDVRLDLGVLAIAAVASVIAAVAGGLAPVLRGIRVDVSAVVRGGVAGGSVGGDGIRTQRVRSAILVLQTAFAAILLVGAILMAHSFVRLLDVDPGYRADQVLTARVLLPRLAPPQRTEAVIDHVLTRLRTTPEVTTAGAGNMMPHSNMTAVRVLPVPAAQGGVPIIRRSLTYVVTPGYAETLGLRLREGRLLTEADMSASPWKILVNEEFVRQFLVGEAIGRQFSDWSITNRITGVTTEIVGIVGNVLKDGNDQDPQPEIYFARKPVPPYIPGVNILVVRATGDPIALTSVLRDAVREADLAAVVDQIAPLSDLAARSVAQPRFAMTVLVSFAVFALVLVSVGLYGVLSYSVAQRHRELGVRAAVGAARSDLVQLVLREGLALTLMGAAIGVLAASWMTQFMQAALFRVSSLDTVAFVVGPLVLLIAATLASLRPAVRAASMDPIIALRGD
jgi:putative ABC transport system permease protein